MKTRKSNSAKQKTMWKTRTAFIAKILPLSLSAIMFTGCSLVTTNIKPDKISGLTAEDTVSQTAAIVSQSTEETTTTVEETAEPVSLGDRTVIFDGDSSSEDITEEDFKKCKEDLESDGAFTLVDNRITAYDIDNDGKDEMLALYGYFFFVFEKEEGKITETHRSQVVLSETGNIRLDNLKIYSEGEEKYPYFTFHYDNNMVCDVLGAIKYDKDKDSYNLEYIISWGKLTYEGDASQFNHSFFRKGWNYMERSAEPYVSDISQEEFLEIYNKYEGLPDWDTYVKEYDLLS